MALRGRLEVKVIISSASDLKNVNLGHGPLRPYAVVSVPPNPLFRTRIDLNGHTSPTYDDPIYIPLVSPDESTTLLIELYHSNEPGDNDPVIGSARLPLMVIIDEVGFGQDHRLVLQLLRPSGRPQGTVDATFAVRSAPYADHVTASYPSNSWVATQSQPTVVAGHPSGTAYGSRMWNNHHGMWMRLVVCAVALCLRRSLGSKFNSSNSLCVFLFKDSSLSLIVLWALLTYVDFKNVGRADACRVEKNQEKEEGFVMMMYLVVGLIALLKLGMATLMELRTRWTKLPTMWPKGLMVCGDSDDEDGFGSDTF